MPFNGNGTYTNPYFPIDDRDDSIPISASKFQEFFQNDLTQTFALCMTTDSQTKPIANVDINNFKVINVSDATLSHHAVNKGQLDTVETKADDNAIDIGTNTTAIGTNTTAISNRSSFVDFTSGVSFSTGTDHTATEDGLVICSWTVIGSQLAQKNLTVDGVVVFSLNKSYQNASTTDTNSFFIKAGQVFNLDSTNTTLTFYSALV